MSDDEQMPALESAPVEAAPATEAPVVERPKPNRSEKKSRKAMSKLGLKQVEGIFRVTLKRNKSIIFAIQNPDVFKSPTSDTYVIFGNAQIEDFASAAQSGAAQSFQAPKETPAAEPTVTEEVEEVDEEGVDEKDIELIMGQLQGGASVSRAKVVKALKENDGDIVNTLMSLSSA
eukprot:TRINITY_DN31290_c1_g1_i1.p2 TRINITY_DN31290_c1_g1~~TRINITY_DN31290_c1_g1_i1.p2  ORF type:complete len:175 (-),score=45.32 TRINITY_DN31290_c1_g1_i1:115-639(-)